MREFPKAFAFLIVFSTIFATILSSYSFAQNGTIVGTAPKVKKFLAGTTRVYSLGSSAVYGKDLTSKRTFQFSVPEGGYVVLSDVLGKNEKASSISVVPVKKGKKSSVRALASASPAIRISVGNILLKTPDGKVVKGVNGQNITVDGLMIVDLLNAKNECNFAIVEDRKFGRFKDVLKEIKLQSSNLSANKINYKSAIALLNANAPQYRLSGSVEVSPQGDLTGDSSLQIINLKNGEILWQKSFTGGGTNFANFSESLAQSAADALCIPQQILGTFTGLQKLVGSGYSVTYSWTGAATFKFLNYIGQDPSKPENLNVALYQYISGEISSYSAEGTNNGCTVSGEVASLQPEFPSTGALLVYLDPAPGKGYKYSLAVTLQKPNAIDISTSCQNGTDVRSDAATAELSVSPSDDDLPTTSSLHHYSGSITIDDTDMNWDFNSQL
jgi:hypothetical protein